CAQAEDKEILSKLLSLEGRNTVPLLDWSETGSPFQNVVDATQALVEDGFFGPYAVILSPALYNQTQRYGKGMRLESHLIADVAKGGLFQSPVLKAGEGLFFSMGNFYLDLTIGQDLVTDYIGNEELTHLFRVFETIALRIKRPEAVCTFES
ncbi:MAG: family 1 encapsulin nanocompartment shell protein, partial [Anaerolineae bacterium]